MCGIVGVFNLKNDENRAINDKQQAFLINFLLTEGLLYTEYRGKDATGYYCVFENGSGIGLKHSEKSSEFVFKDNDDKKLNFAEHMRAIERYHVETSPVAVAIGHCRASSVGGIYNNDNNHPVIIDDRFIAIHNGTLSNRSKIETEFKDRIKRVGDVDSELLVHMANIWKQDNNNNSFSIDTCNWIYSKLEGSCATIIVDREDPTKIMWVKSARPMLFVYMPTAGLLLILSEYSIYNDIKKQYAKLKNIYNIDMPHIICKTTTAVDNHCGIIDLNKQIPVYKDITYKEIEGIAGDTKLEVEKDAGFVTGTTTSWYNTNKTNNDNKGGTNNKAGTDNNTNNENSKGTKTTNPTTSVGNSTVIEGTANSDTQNKNNTNTEDDDMEGVKVLVWVNGVYEQFTEVPDKIKPEFTKNRNIDRAKMYSTIYEKMPLKQIYTEFSIDKKIKEILGESMESIRSMDKPGVARNVEKMCAHSIVDYVLGLSKTSDKYQNSAMRARKRMFALKKFINLILPYVSTDNNEAMLHSLHNARLTDGDIDFLGKFVSKSVLKDSDPILTSYINGLLKDDKTKTGAGYA